MNSIPPASFSADDVLRQAIVHHQAGQFADAEKLYRTILQTDQRHPGANHNLGVLACQAGQVLAGLPYLKTAYTLKPADGQYALSYTQALLASGQTQEALKTIKASIKRGLKTPEARYLRQQAEEAVRGEWLASRNAGLKKGRSDTKVLAPQQSCAESLPPGEHHHLISLYNAGRHVELENCAQRLSRQYPSSGLVWTLLGVSLGLQGKDALFALQRAAQLLPDDAGAHSNLGHCLEGQGRFDEAVASCRRAIEINPGYADAHVNLGVALRGLGRLDEALASYARALAIKPDDAEVYNYIGKALRGLGRLDEAMESFRRALAIRPDYADAYVNQGLAQLDLGHQEAAIADCRRALAIKPDFAEADNGLGSAQQQLGQLDEALASYRRALAINPDFVDAHSNLGTLLMEVGRFDEAEASYRRALAIKPDFADAHSNLLFTRNYRAEQSAAMSLAEARCFNALVVRKASPYTAWGNSRESDRCLRVGMVSGDFCSHPVGYFVEGVAAALAANHSGRLELFAYSANPVVDALTERFKASCHGWHCVVGLSDQALARQVRDDGIDILIDLAGHTAHNRLPMFAWKPAPVQVSWLGYFATTGLAAIDYFLADPLTLPPSLESHFTEKVWRLPETRLCFTPPDIDVAVSSLPALSNGYVTFACFNTLHKMNDRVVELWARVLAAVPYSRLFLKAKQLKDATSRQRTVERFVAHGIDADRLVLEESSSRADYLATYQRVDIALDPFPFPGGTTSVDSLWMGVPVLTLAGESFLSRQGLGLLMNAGLPDWVASDRDDYVARAVAQASDLQALANLRQGLRQQLLASPILDAARFAVHFEAALRSMWTQWSQG